jgi:hypothetical protein
VVRTFKSISAIKLFKRFPDLKKFYSRCGSLWSKGYFASSVGKVSEATVNRYIQEQKSKPYLERSMHMKVTKEKVKKTRKKNEQTTFTKTLNVIRKFHTPLNVIEVEMEIVPFQDFKMKRIGEHLRVIRNTVLGELYKGYKQMIRTKKYKTLLKQYRSVFAELTKDTGDKKLIEKEINNLKEQLAELRDTHNVTFEFARNYGAELREKKFKLPDAVTVWSVCEMAWNTLEKILFSDGEKPYFYKKEDLITFQGKQAERSIILKHNKISGTFFVSHNGMNFPLLIKRNDLFTEETLSHFVNYMENGEELDRINVECYLLGKSVLPTYRIRNKTEL